MMHEETEQDRHIAAKVTKTSDNDKRKKKKDS